MTMLANFRLMILSLAALTIGCTMPLPPNPNPITSSTQGSTLVRMATITAVGGALADDAPAVAAGAKAANTVAPPSVPSGPAARTRIVTELVLLFDDGASGTYRIEPGEVFQPGERVKVTTRSGNTRITH